MALLLFVLFLVISIIVYWITNDDDAIYLPGVICFVALVVVIIAGVNVVNGRVIDSKIAMYQEENKNIENQMDILVEKYMDYESETFGDLKGESSITLVSLYPELKADEIVKSQVEVYTNNNKTIKELKEWMLVFGMETPSEDFKETENEIIVTTRNSVYYFEKEQYHQITMDEYLESLQNGE